MKRIVLASLGGGLAGFLYGWLVYGMLLVDAMSDTMTNFPGLMKEEPMIWSYFVSNSLMALMLTYVFTKWANISDFKNGAVAGLVLGGLVVLAYDIQFWGTTNMMSGSDIMIDIVVGLVMYAVTGGVCALILGKVKD